MYGVAPAHRSQFSNPHKYGCRERRGKLCHFIGQLHPYTQSSPDEHSGCGKGACLIMPVISSCRLGCKGGCRHGLEVQEVHIASGLRGPRLCPLPHLQATLRAELRVNPNGVCGGNVDALAVVRRNQKHLRLWMVLAGNASQAHPYPSTSISTIGG